MQLEEITSSYSGLHGCYLKSKQDKQSNSIISYVREYMSDVTKMLDVIRHSWKKTFLF